MFYDIFARFFGWQHLYEFRHTSGAMRCYNVVFALDYNPRAEKKAKTTRSWRKAKKWVDEARSVTPMGYIPNTSWMEATCGEVNDFDIHGRKITLNCGTLKPLCRCRKGNYRRWM